MLCALNTAAIYGTIYLSPLPLSPSASLSPSLSLSVCLCLCLCLSLSLSLVHSFNQENFADYIGLPIKNCLVFVGTTPWWLKCVANNRKNTSLWKCTFRRLQLRRPLYSGRRNPCTPDYAAMEPLGGGGRAGAAKLSRQEWKRKTKCCGGSRRRESERLGKLPD